MKMLGFLFVPLLKKLEIKDRKKILVCTYHPETKKKSTYEDLKTLLSCLSTLDKDKFSIVFTASNGDKEGKKFNKLINATCKKTSNFYFFKSLSNIHYSFQMQFKYNKL